MKHVILIIVLLFVNIGFSQTSLDDLLKQYNTRSVPYISVEGLRALQLNEDIILLDTRENSEYSVSKLEGAQCVGFNDFSIETISEEILDKNTPIIVYCSLGIRSEQIGEKLQKEGFTNVRNLYGGIFEWKNNGYPVVDSEQIETDSVHVYSKLWRKWLNNGIPVFEKTTNNK